MVKQSKTQRTSRKPWILVGVLLTIVLIGASGCSQSKATSTPSTSQEQPNQGRPNQGQPGQGQRSRNPALQAAMEIRRLQSDSQNALTSDQKDKIKPILQELIDTSTANPSQDILQQKADAINAVLTDQQKSSLTKPRTSNGTIPNENTTKGNNPQGGTGAGAGGADGRQAGSAMKPQTIYQQVLDSLK